MQVVSNGGAVFTSPVRAVETPGILLQAVVILGDKTAEGQLVRAVAVPWFEIVRELQRDPDFAYKLDWRQWEEMIAGAYQREGGWEVELTPRSGDGGRDVIATRPGIGSVRFFDQVKAYHPGHLVTADQVRSMLGVLTSNPNVSKGIVTTTSDFAPGIAKDESIQQFIPHRLELKPREPLLAWLAGLVDPPPSR